LRIADCGLEEGGDPSDQGDWSDRSDWFDADTRRAVGIGGTGGAEAGDGVFWGEEGDGFHGGLLGLVEEAAGLCLGAGFLESGGLAGHDGGLAASAEIGEISDGPSACGLNLHGAEHGEREVDAHGSWEV
jgi:hypothetical protein